MEEHKRYQGMNDKKTSEDKVITIVVIGILIMFIIAVILLFGSSLPACPEDALNFSARCVKL